MATPTHPGLRVLVVLAASAIASGWKCGVDDPVHGPHLHVEAPRVAQVYETPELLERARRLNANQVYPDSGAFVPIDVADAAGLTGPIRIKVHWDVVTSGDVQTSTVVNGASRPRQCTVAGGDIDVRSSSGSGWSAWAGCALDNLVTGASGADRFAAMSSRTAEAVNFWQRTLKVKPVQDAITVPAGSNPVTDGFGVPSGTSWPGFDLVLIMTARPSPFSPIAGFAVCLQRDQRGRCTIGQFNWVPEVLNVANKNAPDVHESELHTALHELVHVLGGMSPGVTSSDTPFVHPTTGLPLTTGVFQVEDDPAYVDDVAAAVIAGHLPMGARKQRTLITTPRVVNFTRTYLGCPTAAGMALEDVPLGKGSHWEARIMGPELMSYGSGSGQVYISDLTLGFLEDTNQYIANYSNAGPLLPPEVDDYATYSAVLFTNTANKGYKVPTPAPVGALRWGAGAGCSFMDAKATAAWPARYLCAKNQEYLCTSDNRMAAVCVVRSDWISQPAKPTCGAYHQYGTNGDTQAGPTCDLDNDTPLSGGAATYGIPTYMRVYASDAAASAAAGASGALAATTGGFNDAMDYAPVPVGYWNCMYGKPSDNASTTSASEYGNLLRAVSAFGKSTDMDNFGGQARCPQCRCFVSSLMEITRTITPTFASYGLCYRANCFQPDYLQVAVKGQLQGDVMWYKCPTDGGKLYIPGFTGSIHCPRAVDFCAMETVTGVKYPETDLVLEAIFWGLVGATLLVTLAMCAFPGLRNRLIGCTKRCCGARVFDLPHAGEPGSAKNHEDGLDDRALPRCAAWTLLSVNALTLLLGGAVLGITGYALYVAKVYSFAISGLGLGVLTILLSIVGLCAARKRADHGPSCWVLTYFMVDLVVSALLLWGVAWNLAFANWETYVDRYWDVVTSTVPAGVLPTAGGNVTRADEVAAATAYVESNITAVAGLFIAVLVIFLATLFASARIIKGRTLAAIFLTFINNVGLLVGIMMIVIGAYFIAFKGGAAGSVAVVSIILTVGLGFLIVAIVGHVGVFRRKQSVMGAYIGLVACLLAVAAGATYACFAKADDVRVWVAAQPDEQLAAVAAALGYAVDMHTIITTLQDNLRRLGLAFGVIMLVLLAIIIDAGLFILAVRAFRQEVPKEGVPHAQPATVFTMPVHAKGPAPIILGGAPSPTHAQHVDIRVEVGRRTSAGPGPLVLGENPAPRDPRLARRI